MNRWDWKIKRMKKKITFAEMTDYVDCSLGLLSMYENGERNMSNDKVKRYKEYIENN